MARSGKSCVAPTALGAILRGYPHLTVWAKLCRASGAGFVALAFLTIAFDFAFAFAIDLAVTFAFLWEPPHLCGGGALQRSGKSSCNNGGFSRGFCGEKIPGLKPFFQALAFPPG